MLKRDILACDRKAYLAENISLVACAAMDEVAAREKPLSAEG